MTPADCAKSPSAAAIDAHQHSWSVGLFARRRITRAANHELRLRPFKRNRERLGPLPAAHILAIEDEDHIGRNGQIRQAEIGGGGNGSVRWNGRPAENVATS